MSENISNREVLEKFAREVMQMQTQEQVDSFINTFVYAMIGLI